MKTDKSQEGPSTLQTLAVGIGFLFAFLLWAAGFDWLSHAIGGSWIETAFNWISHAWLWLVLGAFGLGIAWSLWGKQSSR